MALLDLKTNLKSLKYGNDTPGGGNSGQPYQQVDINKVDSGFNQFRMTKFDDGLVRGGVVGAANASIVDTFRIGKFLKDFPKGPLFIVKQIGLQLSNPKIETSKTGRGNIGKIGPTRIYNLGINTLAQVPVNAFGQHFNRHGLLPVQDAQTKYLAVTQINNIEGTNGKDNRLNILRNRFGLGADYNPYGGAIELRRRERINRLSGRLSQTDYDKIQNSRIDDYIGGPSSVYGIGRTLISRTPERTNDKLKIDAAKNRNYNAQHIPEVKINNSFDFGISLLTTSSLANSSFDLIKDTNLNINSSLLNYDYKNNYSSSLSLAGANQKNSYSDANNKIKTSLGFVGVSTKTSSSFISNKLPDLTDFGMLGEFKRNTLEDQIASKNDVLNTKWTAKGQEASASAKMREPKSFTGVSQYSSSVFSTSRFPNLTSTTGDLYKPQTLNPYTASNADTSTINTIGKWDGKLTASADLGLSNLKNSQGSTDVFGIDVPTDIAAIDKSLNQNVINYSNPTIKKYSELRNVITATNNAYKDLNTSTIGVDREQADIVLKNKKGIEITNELKNKFVRTNDIYPFEDSMALKFVPLDPFTGQPLSLTLNFLGYITEFTENYTSTWGDVKYTGRSEKFYIFNEFNRDVQVGFNIPCFHPDELEAKHCQLSELASTLAGKYNDNILLGGIITKLRLGNYVNDQPGIIRNLTFSPIQDSSWDLDKKLAFYIKVSFGFTVIHNFLPQHYPCGFIFKEPDPVPQTKPPREEPVTSSIQPTTSSLIPETIAPEYRDNTYYRFGGRAGEFQGQRGKTPPLTEKDIRPFTQTQDDALKNWFNKAVRD